MNTTNTIYQSLINENSADFNNLTINGKHIDTHIVDNILVPDANPNITNGESLEVFDDTASNLNVKLIKQQADVGSGEIGYVLNLDATNNFQIKKDDNNTLTDKLTITDTTTTINNNVDVNGNVFINGNSLEVDADEDGVPATLTLRTTSSTNQQPSIIKLYETNYNLTPPGDYGVNLAYKNGIGNPFSIQTVANNVAVDRITIPRDTGTKIKIQDSGLSTNKFLRLNTNQEIESATHDDSDINTLEDKTQNQTATASGTTFTGDLFINTTNVEDDINALEDKTQKQTATVSGTTFTGDLFINTTNVEDDINTLEGKTQNQTATVSGTTFTGDLIVNTTNVEDDINALEGKTQNQTATTSGTTFTGDLFVNSTNVEDDINALEEKTQNQSATVSGTTFTGDLFINTTNVEDDINTLEDKTQNQTATVSGTTFTGDLIVNTTNVEDDINTLEGKTQYQSTSTNNTTFDTKLTINGSGVVNPILHILSSGVSNDPGGEIRMTESDVKYGWIIRNNHLNGVDDLEIINLYNNAETDILQFDRNGVVVPSGSSLKLDNQTANRLIYLDASKKIVSNPDGYTWTDLKTILDDHPSDLQDLLDKTQNILLPDTVSGRTELTGQLKINHSSTTDYTLQIESENTTSSASPELDLYRNSISPADADYLGILRFSGNNSSGSRTLYGKITGKINDTTLGTEDGIIEITTKRNGLDVIQQRQTEDTLFLLNGNNLNVNGSSSFNGASTFTTQSVHNNGIQCNGTLDVNGNLDVSGTSIFGGTSTFTVQSVHNGGIDCNGQLEASDKIIYRPGGGNKLVELSTPSNGIGFVLVPDFSGGTNRFDVYTDSSGNNTIFRYADNSLPKLTFTNSTNRITLDSTDVYLNAEQTRLSSTTNAKININASNDNDVLLEFTRGSATFGNDGSYDYRFRNSGGVFYLEEGNGTTIREHTKYQWNATDLITETNSKFYINSGYLEVDSNNQNTNSIIKMMATDNEGMSLIYNPTYENDGSTLGGRFQIEDFNGVERFRVSRSSGWAQVVDWESFTSPTAIFDLVRGSSSTNAFYGGSTYNSYRLQASGGNFFLKGKNSSLEKTFLSYYFDNNIIGLGDGAGGTTSELNSIAIGKSAGINGLGQYSIAIGTEASSNTLSKDFRVDVGYRAGYSNCQQNGVAIGRLAGEVKQGHNSLDPLGPPNDASCVAIGYLAGNANQGMNSVAVGENSGAVNQGYRSVAIGTQAGYYLPETYTTSVGYRAGVSNQGNASVAIGYEAGALNTSAANNRYTVSIGERAGYSNVGQFAVAIGSGAGRHSMQSYSIALGRFAGSNLMHYSSVAIGNGALRNGVSGRYQGIAIGTDAGASNLGNYSIGIGRSANFNGGNFDRTIVINASGVALNPAGADRCYMKPMRNTASTYQLWYNNTSGELSYGSSSRDGKKNIVDVDTETTKNVYNLQVREFDYKEESENQHRLGLIAEEVSEIEPKFTLYEEGKACNVDWDSITAALIKEVQELRKELNELKNNVVYK